MAEKMTPGRFAKLYLELDLFLYDPEYAPGGRRRATSRPKKWTKVKANRYRLGRWIFINSGMMTSSTISASRSRSRS